MYKPRKQKRAKVKAPPTVTWQDDKECHKILQSQDSYHAKVKALKYLEFTHDTIGHQKVTEKLSAPKIKGAYRALCARCARAVRALCEKLAVLHHREFGKFRRLEGSLNGCCSGRGYRGQNLGP